jgi:hypothetical protein
MLLATAGASQVSASLTTVPGVVLYLTALEIALRASWYREFSKCQFVCCECKAPKLRFTMPRIRGGNPLSIVGQFFNMRYCP